MQAKLLTDTEACIHLGITKELLYAYIRNAPKKALNHDRKLISVEIDGRNMFELSELDSFDAYLKEPWSNPGDKRPEIPSYIQEYLKTEIGGKCPITEKGYPLDNAHIEDYSVSRSHHHHNIIRIAKDEHTKFDNGVLSKSTLIQAKASLIDSLRQRLRAELDKAFKSIRIPKPHHLFLGRDLELIQLVHSMETDRLIVIEGIGGMGKTQLLLNALDNVKYHNPVIWIDAEALSTMEDLLMLVSNEISKIDRVVMQGNLIDTLATTRITLVIDSLESLLIPFRDEVEDFIDAVMTQSEEVQLLITSQIDLNIFDQQKTLFKLDGVSDDYSEAIVKSFLHEAIQMSDTELEWIIDFCGGHPLSLKLSASLVLFFRSAEKAISHLQQADSLKQPLRRKHDKSTALSICLSTIYNHLTDDQKKILHYTKFFPGGVKRINIKSNAETSDFDENLAVLQQFFLIDIIYDILDIERISVQNPFRKFLYDRSLSENAEHHYDYERSVLLEISMEAMIIHHYYIETSVYGSAEFGILRMEAEFPNIMEAFTLAKKKFYDGNKSLIDKASEEYHLIIGSITSSLGKFFFVRGAYELGISMAKEGIKNSMERKMYDDTATQYVYLSQLQARQHDFFGVAHTIQELEQFAETTKNENAIICLHWVKGRLHAEKGENQEALSHLEKAVELMKILMEKNLAEENKNLQKIHPDEPINMREEGNVGLIYNEIGRIYEDTHKPNKALEYYKLGLEIQVKLNDEVNALSCYYHLANCFIDLDRFEEAFEFYFICIEGFLSHRNYEYLTNTMAELGRQTEQYPELAVNKQLTEEAFQEALGNLSDRIQSLVHRSRNQNQEFNIESIPHEMIGHMILLTKLTSFSEYKFCLYGWAKELMNELNIDNGVNYFTAIISLANIVGSYDHWQTLSTEEREEHIRMLHLSCFVINGGPDLKSKTRIFFWLAKWMQYTGLDKDATADKLWNTTMEIFAKQL